MKVFLTGATGYIGGSIAEKLIARGHEVLALVRDDAKAAALAAKGISIIKGDLNNESALRLGAQECDAVLNAADADHLFAAQTLIDALTGSGKVLIHTSGSSIVCDDALGAFASDRVFTDDAPFAPQSHRLQRISVDKLVRKAGIDAGIRTAVVCPTMVYGEGRGLHKDSDQLPKLIKKSREVGAGVYIETGKNIWSNVHIDDLTDLYLLVMERAPSASFFFAENGSASFESIANSVSHGLGFDGKTVSWSIHDAMGEYGDWARVALATNARVEALNAKQLLGWTPSSPKLEDVMRAGKF